MRNKKKRRARPKKKAKVAEPRRSSVAVQEVRAAAQEASLGARRLMVVPRTRVATQAPPLAAPAPTVSRRAAIALDHVWDMKWGTQNPFRMRLTTEALAYFQMDDYCTAGTRVSEPAPARFGRTPRRTWCGIVVLAQQRVRDARRGKAN